MCCFYLIFTLPHILALYCPGRLSSWAPQPRGARPCVRLHHCRLILVWLKQLCVVAAINGDQENIWWIGATDMFNEVVPISPLSVIFWSQPLFLFRAAMFGCQEHLGPSTCRIRKWFLKKRLSKSSIQVGRRGAKFEQDRSSEHLLSIRFKISKTPPYHLPYFLKVLSSGNEDCAAISPQSPAYGVLIFNKKKRLGMLVCSVMMIFKIL